MVQDARTTPAAELDEKFRELTISAFHAAPSRGEITAAELVDWYLARIEAHNLAGAELQAVVTVNPEPATRPSLGTSSSPPRASSAGRSTVSLCS